MINSFDDLLAKLSSSEMKTVCVANAQEVNVIEAVKGAKEKNIAKAILVGDEKAIRKMAADANFDLEGTEIVDEPDMIEASLKAVKLVHDGKADIYMKGAIDSKNFLRSVLNKEVGLRTGEPLSHVAVVEVKALKKLLVMTDVAFVPYPTLEDKVHLINHAVDVARACGFETPKVAPIAAVEVVNPKMPVTVEAAELTKMNEEGTIKNCIVDGPLSFDLAIDPEAAHHKEGASDRKIVGDADVLLFPDIHAGNITYKALGHLSDTSIGCVLAGTSAPTILTSRSDSYETKLNSIALAAVIAEGRNK